MTALLILIVILVVALLVVWWTVATRNSFVRLMNLVAESWHQVDVELKRRHDLIPNLVQTVQGYANHEREVFALVTQARADAIQAGAASSPAAVTAAENQVSQALGRLFAVAEGYPELKADAAFRQLQQSLSDTEDRIAASRRFYNQNVRRLNTKIDTFPASLVAGWAGAVKADYFQIDDAARGDVRVDFTSHDAPAVTFTPPATPQAPGAPGYPTAAPLPPERGTAG